MSLKAFHLVFITAASALGFGCGIWELWDYWGMEGRWPALLFGLGSLVAGAGLLVYERYFLKKLRNVSYL
jgi:hypothetical protein